ncbi:MAG: hypothetical protein JRI23_36250 [Deltaproteobacteria bacterium]|jgi:hypothetical protein|nr:hypothetical protein [Deltaproteobacteria bacterium]MBW2537802.1 hypothetical protein [Deltaproteobacteria bacterium]
MNEARVAVPLFGEEVAPRFCSADRVLLADVLGRSVGPLHRISLGDASWAHRLAELAAAGVTVLLCGGFNRRFHPLAERHGIEVIWGLFGSAERLVHAYADGALDGFRLALGPARSCEPPVGHAPSLGRGGRRTGSGRGRRARHRRGKER